ncbi:hypothetical protein BS47DRAFT_1362271 [Hydnum rufescens UP504]|uniref:FAD-binding domain-containing protein n=1 Tax=Hydnum rufescens UP504 TaxID=1448309 RepID=A0A9P6DSY3_9AGAM|nr:hypothetical protein BS47DRAFT_1362271 [Hydnum rufescens UP504]
MSSPQALIVGGLAAALVLRKNGIPVRLIERALDYQIGVRGNGIQVNAMDLPGSLVLDPPTQILKLFKILGLVTDIFDNSIEPPQMRGRLCVTVKLGTELVDFTQDAHKVTTNLLKHDKRGSSENEGLEVDWVIGTDGARGITPKRLGINFWGETLEKQAFPVAEVDMEGLNREFLALSFPYENIGPPMEVPPPGLGNGTPKEIQKVVDIICRNEDELIQAGDRALDGPNFVLVPASAQDILHALRKYNKDGDRLLDLESESVLVDTQGHVRRAYDVDATQARKALPSVIIIRPDTYFVHDPQLQGEEKYFAKISVQSLRGCVITLVIPRYNREAFASLICRGLVVSLKNSLKDWRCGK